MSTPLGLPPIAFFSLLQLVSSALPVGAYSYSEGIETLVQTGQITNLETLEHWLTQELRSGALRVETLVLRRVYEALTAGQLDHLITWNHWLSAFRETEELREQSWQMGRSLTRLLSELYPQAPELLDPAGEPWNFAVGFAIAAYLGEIDLEVAIAGYLYSWASNLVTAGVRLIPLGQTQGQKLLMNLAPVLAAAADTVMQAEERLPLCTWGMAIASMQHETLYSRLFRS
ncbi:MAG: urease accessory protein UreF [Oculatellaceae cyanobacterium Prado106]|jgi:urease accessory protein|nr:urease accessory protein UreF [Oculatellaceae cyanobacterium Prado106]